MNNQKTYIVGYEYRFDDMWDSDSVEVEASSEEEALQKAKDRAPRSAHKFKIVQIKENRKMKKSEAVKMIRETILSAVNEKKKKDTEEVDNAETDETPEETTPTEPTVSPEIKIIQTALTKLQTTAQGLGDDKLDKQISNLITFFTREHVSKGK